MGYSRVDSRRQATHTQSAVNIKDDSFQLWQFLSTMLGCMRIEWGKPARFARRILVAHCGSVTLENVWYYVGTSA